MKNIFYISISSIKRYRYKRFNKTTKRGVNFFLIIQRNFHFHFHHPCDNKNYSNL